MSEEVKKPAFTPGPWVWDRLGDVETVDGKDIATTEAMTQESLANAALIAAAPDLYEALTGVVDLYVELVNSGDAGFWDPEDVSAIVAARAALRKANGGE